MKKYLQFIKTIFINILFLYIMLYFLEIYFQIKSKNLFKETSYYKFKELTSKQKLMPMIRPTHLKDIHSNKIVPVSIVSNVKTLLCMDGNDPIYFKSDINGFDNENIDIGNEVDIILLGDSFAAGYCVKKEFRFNYLFKQKGIDIINFGMGGNGPLLEFASLVEYADLYNFKTIILLFTPENDYENFEREMQNPILSQYLDYNFKQDLKEKNAEKDQLYYNYYKKKNRPFREFLRLYHLDLGLIRNKIKKINFKTNRYSNQNNTENSINYNAETIKKVNIVFKNLKKYADINEKRLLVVYNALHPKILFENANNNLKKVINENKLFLKKEGIDFFDFSDYIYSNYNKSNIDEILKKRINNYWDHYTNLGYSLLTEQILIKIKNIQNK